MFLDLKGDFYTWAIREVEKIELRDKKILCFGDAEPSLFQPLIDKGHSIEFKIFKDLNEIKKESFSIIFCPSFFLYNQKEISESVASVLCSVLNEEGEIFLLFGPSWLPSNWSEEGAKMIKEGERRLIFRLKNTTLSFCYYTNREIEVLFSPLKLNRLIILQNGFRRVHLQKFSDKTSNK